MGFGRNPYVPKAQAAEEKAEGGPGELARAREIAFDELKERAQALGANAVVGIDIDYEVVGQNGSMLMVSISGTAVVV